MRLTKPNKNYASCYPYLSEEMSKLQWYENLEEEIGIELFILINLIRKQIYYIKNGKICNSYWVLFDFRNPQLVVYENEFDNEPISLGLDKYGKTWSLVKEDLL